MKSSNCAVILMLFLIQFKLIHIKCYGLDRSGLCSLERDGDVPNICDPSNHLVYVTESENGCRTTGIKCWCLLIDNRNLVYDGDVVIELVQLFNRKNLHPDEIQFGEVKSFLTFKLISGLNRILVQPYAPPEAVTHITSIKVTNNEICKLSNTLQVPSLSLEPSNNNNISNVTNEDDSGEEYRILADCMFRNTYTENSTRYCPSDRPEFMIEKRSNLNNQIYWCINIDNVNYTLTSANHLHLEYTSSNRYFIYSPSDAYTERELPGSDFHLGNRRTIISISEYNNQLADLKSVTIDNQTICSYFEPPIILSRVAAPTVKLYPIMQPSVSPKSIENLVEIPDLVDYKQSIVPEVDQQKPINLSTKSCGIKSNRKNSLISFGLHTNPGDWPWHAAIYKLQTRTSNRIYVCGGTLIDRRTIVTAAHCVSEFNLVVIPERLTVELGRHDLTHSSVATQEYRLYDVIPHESYNPDTFENDIAILILANYVQLTRYVQYVCLPNPNAILLNQIGKTVGWGRDSNNKLQSELKEASLPVVDHITCLMSNREFFGRYLTHTNYCAGYMNNTNVCRGDSGGGLVFNNKRQWFLGGITSFGVLAKSVDQGCDIRQYVIFTDVTKFVTWIKRNS